MPIFAVSLLFSVFLFFFMRSIHFLIYVLFIVYNSGEEQLKNTEQKERGNKINRRIKQLPATRTTNSEVNGNFASP